VVGPNVNLPLIPSTIQDSIPSIRALQLVQSGYIAGIQIGLDRDQFAVVGHVHASMRAGLYYHPAFTLAPAGGITVLGCTCVVG
jgi:hypothetical protein